MVSAGLCGLIAWCGPVDPPRERGSHKRPTPTSGGLGLLAGASVGAALALGWGRLGGDEGHALAAALCMAGGLGLLGAVDDLFDIGAKAKLGLQALAAVVFAAWVARVQALPLTASLALPLGPWLGVAGTALWIVVATNAVNFMDGANGVAGGALAVAFAALGLGAGATGEPGVAALAWAAAGANLGFLPFNLAGRLFQGDAGALFSGVLFSALCVVAERGGSGLYLYFGPLVLLPFLTDVLLTLLWRARRRRPLLEAHRDHLYQLWLQRTGRSHAALALRVAVLCAAYAALGLALQAATPGVRLAAFVAAVALSVAGWTVWRRRLEESVPS